MQLLKKIHAYSESARNSGSESGFCKIFFSRSSGFFLDDIFSGHRWESLKQKFLDFYIFKKTMHLFLEIHAYSESARNSDSESGFCKILFSRSSGFFLDDIFSGHRWESLKQKFLDFQIFKKSMHLLKKIHAYSESARNSDSESGFCNILFSRSSGFFLDDIFSGHRWESLKQKFLDFYIFKKSMQ